MSLRIYSMIFVICFNCYADDFCTYIADHIDKYDTLELSLFNHTSINLTINRENHIRFVRHNTDGYTVSFRNAHSDLTIPDKGSQPKNQNIELKLCIDRHTDSEITFIHSNRIVETVQITDITLSKR